MKIKKNCICGNNFLSYPSQNKKYCSPKCYTNTNKGIDMPWLHKWRHSKRSDEVKKNMSNALKGLKKSLTHRKNISKAKRGKPAWNKGLHRPDFQREKSNRWKGGRRVDQHGYVWIYTQDHPFRKQKSRVLQAGYIQEHRLVMEKSLGRYLHSWEKVHHRNAIKHDNRIENLQIVTAKIHYGEVECPGCAFKFLIR